MQSRTHTPYAPLLVGLMISALALASLPLQSHASEQGGAARRVNVDATCMAAAVDTRETALAAAWDELNTGMTSALKERKDALKAAWEITTPKDRNAAVVKAWKEWRTDKKALNTEFRKDRKAAWDAFKKTAKSECKATLPKEEAQDQTEKDSVSL